MTYPEYIKRVSEQENKIHIENFNPGNRANLPDAFRIRGSIHVLYNDFDNLEKFYDYEEEDSPKKSIYKCVHEDEEYIRTNYTLGRYFGNQFNDTITKDRRQLAKDIKKYKYTGSFEDWPEKYIDSFDRALEYLIPKISNDIHKRSTDGKLVITSVLDGRSDDNRFEWYLKKLKIDKSKILPLLKKNVVVVPNLFVKRKNETDIKNKYEKTIKNVKINSEYKSFMNPNNRFFILDDVNTRGNTLDGYSEIISTTIDNPMAKIIDFVSRYEKASTIYVKKAVIDNAEKEGIDLAEHVGKSKNLEIEKIMIYSLVLASTQQYFDVQLEEGTYISIDH